MADLLGVPQESALEVEGPSFGIPCSGESALEPFCPFLLLLVFGVGCAVSLLVSVATDGAGKLLQGR